MKKRELHVVSTGRQQVQEVAHIIAEIHPFIDYFHIREKQKTARELYDFITMLTKKGVPRSKLIMNDRVDVALLAKTAGVQLAYHSLDAKEVKEKFPELMVGRSVHSSDEMKDCANRVDYVIYGHIYSTASKPGIEPRGVDELKKICMESEIPVIAIGGIKPDNVKEVIRAGASGIAVMSGILEATNPLQRAKEYYDRLKN